MENNEAPQASLRSSPEGECGAALPVHHSGRAAFCMVSSEVDPTHIQQAYEAKAEPSPATRAVPHTVRTTLRSAMSDLA